MVSSYHAQFAGCNVDVTVSLQANRMASAQCFLRTQASHNSTVIVWVFTSGIQLCLRALCVCNFAVLQAILQWYMYGVCVQA